MADPAAWEGKRLQLHGLRGGQVDPREARHARIPLQGPEQRHRWSRRHLHRRRPGHVQGRQAEVVLKGTLDARRASTSSRTASWRSARRSTKPGSGTRRSRARSQSVWITDHVIRIGLTGTRFGGNVCERGTSCRHSAPSSCSRASSSAPMRSPLRSPAPGGGPRRLIESGIGAFYLVTALMTVRVGGHDQRVRDRRLLDQVRRSTTRTAAQPLFYKITSYWGGLDGSIMFWVFLLSAVRRASRSTSTASGTAS